MTRLLDSAKVDDAAVSAALDGLHDRGAVCHTYIRADGTNVYVNAVNTGGAGWSGYSKAASGRAAIGGRRLLPVLDGGNIDGLLWIAYDMGSAISLAHHRRRLPTATSLRVLADVARALEEAAAEGVFASELPPHSVFVTGKGARVGDLGTARQGLARTKLKMGGNAAYVPPEVLRGKRAGERSGVYLFGALLHYLLTGTAPPHGRAAPGERGNLNLPASIKAIVATAMADDPDSRPHTVSEAHEMARRTLRGEPPARARKRRGATASALKDARRAVAAKRGTVKDAAKRGIAKRGTLKDAAKRGTVKDAAKRGIVKHATTGQAVWKRAASKVAVAKRGIPTRDAAKALKRVGAIPITPRRAIVVGGALVLGTSAGLLLGTSPDPEPARGQTVTAGGMSVTLPSGRHRVEPRGKGLAVRAPGSLLRARIVGSPLPPPPDARPVQLGALQAWRRSAGGEVRYTVPTSRGTLAVTCRVTASESSRPLRLCERTASTLRLRDASALTLAAAAGESRRLRTAISALRAERDAARARLGGAFTPSDQRVAAQDLAESHERAATVLRDLSGAGPIETAAQAAADAYASLAAAAESGSAEQWTAATAQVRRSDAVLVQAIAAAD